VDINLSSDDEIVHPLEPDVPVDQKVLAGDDARDMRVASVELITPGPIGSSVPEKSKPFTVDRVLVVPPSSKHGQKRPPLATKWSIPVLPVDDSS
jgi:hypothetical protein